MAVLYLIRHAPTPETGKRLTGRLPGVGLDAAGRRTAEAAAAALESAGFAAVYTSPLRRCRETARIVAGPHGLEPIPYRGLVEVDYGAWSGRTLASLRRTKLWRELADVPSRTRFPGGESLVAVQARAVGTAEALAAAHPRETIALVTHGDVITTIAAHYLGMPLDLYHRIGVAPASHTIVRLEGGRPPRVEALNRIPTERSR